MRTLKSLIENKQVWIFCETESLQIQFLRQAEDEGFLTPNGLNPTELFHHQLYGIDDDMTVGYLSNMIWVLTFDSGKADHLRVDYGKYITGEDDYICHKPIVKIPDLAEWDKIAYTGMSRKKFHELCDSFIENQTFEEYEAYIYRYLIESSWRYSDKQAYRIIEDEIDYVEECYKNKTPVSDCAVEIGYGCG